MPVTEPQKYFKIYTLVSAILGFTKARKEMVRNDALRNNKVNNINIKSDNAVGINKQKQIKAKIAPKT